VNPRTCVGLDGRFRVGIHKPKFEVENLRKRDYPAILGRLSNGSPVDNQINFPKDRIHEPCADKIYEIANPFPFRGTTFINSAWADGHAGRPETIHLPLPSPCSLFRTMDQWDPGLKPEDKARLIGLLPRPLCIALAQASTDPEELITLARKACNIIFDMKTSLPVGIGYIEKKDGNMVPDIHDHDVFEVLVNNPYLPDIYKKTLVLKPGVQGKSEIIGEYLSKDENTHVFEYLRRNSYIPWGHFASNMADDAIRYRAKDLTSEDMKGLRHLYYQRVYVRVAGQLGIPLANPGKSLSPEDLEELRKTICQTLESDPKKHLTFNTSLWGWNFGFGFAQSGHRLHASHQMIHQQNALVPGQITDDQGNAYECFSWGDLVLDFIIDYRESTGKNFFKAYLSTILNNERTDGKSPGQKAIIEQNDRIDQASTLGQTNSIEQNPPIFQSSLIVHEDDHVILFAPKAQVSEWELQLMTKKDCSHILEADIDLRSALDQAMLKAIQVLEKLGAQMVTAIELSGRFDRLDSDQHLLYSFIPKLPHAPGTFSEAQLRWISGCYPEDFAHACRRALK
jgi:diadenosine tetraphosphate (Ap4A) HIT family hydrolase